MAQGGGRHMGEALEDTVEAPQRPRVISRLVGVDGEDDPRPRSARIVDWACAALSRDPRRVERIAGR